MERLGATMAIAFVFVLPVGLGQALKVFADPLLLMAGIGVGICSSVIPYVCDQLAMSRLPRASFALMLASLPATTTIIGAILLAQIPSVRDMLGVALVMAASRCTSRREREGVEKKGTTEAQRHREVIEEIVIAGLDPAIHRTASASG